MGGRIHCYILHLIRGIDCQVIFLLDKVDYNYGTDSCDSTYTHRYRYILFLYKLKVWKPWKELDIKEGNIDMSEWEDYDYFIVSMWIQKKGLNGSEGKKKHRKENL